MEPTLGWILLSKDALKRAENHLRDGEQGVRDEIGFLSLHQAYADRFFPGTSVLQTRLRYILFVPWLYNSIAKQKKQGSVSRIVQNNELSLAKRLKDTHGLADGVIGGRSYPKPTSQPPTMVYWNALGTWGILRSGLGGNYPSRAIVHRTLKQQNYGSELIDDDKQPLAEKTAFFVGLPEPPKTWELDKQPLSFQITIKEAEFIQQHLVSVRRPDAPDASSLLACLVENDIAVESLDSPWDQTVLKVISKDEKEALIRAKQIAALTAIGRGIYAALVEHLCDSEDKRSFESKHRPYLEEVVKTYGDDAIQLDVTAISKDAPNLPLDIINILQETKDWLKNGRNFLELKSTYEYVELKRKGKRARLTNRLVSRKRRDEWSPEDYSKASPLTYRWANVKRLLTDLRNAHG